MGKLLQYAAPLILTLGSIGCNSSKITPEIKTPRNPTKYSVELKGTYSKMEGQLQTPASGEPGSSTKGRPTLEELEMDHAYTYGATLETKIGKNTFIIGGEIVRASGKATLEENLTSQNKKFPEGSRVSAHLKQDLYTLGWLRDVYNKNRITAAMGIGGDLLDFNYTLSGVSPVGVDRSYMKAGATVLGRLTLPLSEKLSLQADGKYPLPFANTPQTSKASIKLMHQFSENINTFVGIGFKNIDYEDEQEFPNHIETKNK